MKKNVILLFFGLLLPSMAMAHEPMFSEGFLSGLTHPVLGFDHLLAMISVGILSAQIGGRAIWTLPSTFVAIMLLGGILGMQGISLFSVELGIAFSVFALGTTIAVGKKFPTVFAMFFVGVFAIFHGHAHGTEMPGLVKPFVYALGFVLGTTGIHLAGVLIGYFAKKIKRGALLLRFFGAGIAGIGAYLVIM